MNETTTPNCYECEYRGTVPGDAHSCCNHPRVLTGSKLYEGLVDTLAGRHNAAAKELGIEAHPHGVERGWFLWPANFDPTWLLSCNGFKAAEEKKA